MSKYIKPILRYYGSKYRMLDKIFNLLDLKETDKFLDMFGGSGIVGVNAKHLFNCEVTINDFDENFPLNKSKVLKNLLTFEGQGKSFTESALIYAYRRLQNGYWDKYNQYNKIIDSCKIVNFDVKDWIYGSPVDDMMSEKIHDLIISHNKIYVDPPYWIKNDLYFYDFDSHYGLEKVLKNIIKYWSNNNHKIKIVISYNDCQEIRDLYKDWKIIEIDVKYQSGKSNGHHKRIGKEILITND